MKKHKVVKIRAIYGATYLFLLYTLPRTNSKCLTNSKHSSSSHWNLNLHHITKHSLQKMEIQDVIEYLSFFKVILPGLN